MSVELATLLTEEAIHASAWNGFLHYAGLFGSSKRYGTLTLYSSAPDELIELVRDLMV